LTNNALSSDVCGYCNLNSDIEPQGGGIVVGNTTNPQGDGIVGVNTTDPQGGWIVGGIA
jgi:hypothetical protein